MSTHSRSRGLAAAAGVILVGTTLAGCATRGYVRDQVGGASKVGEAKIGEVQQQVEATQTDITGLKRSDADQNDRMARLSDSAREALARAQEAGKLARGKFVEEMTLTDDTAHFAFNSATLTESARQALDTLANRLKSENQNVYVEIQGHTDGVGPATYNLKLGEERAEAVRRYLNLSLGVPLHRINVISYGASKPIGDNRTREGRAKNRRVTVVVLA